MYLSRYKTNSMFHSYETKYFRLFIASHDTKLSGKSIAYSAMLIYNRLCNEIKSAVCIMKFKKMLINFLLDKSFYSVEEFMTFDP